MSNVYNFIFNVLGTAIFCGTNFCSRLLIVRNLSLSDYAIYGNIYNIFTTISGFIVTYPLSVFIIQNYQLNVKKKQGKEFALHIFLFSTILIILAGTLFFLLQYPKHHCNYFYQNLLYGIPLLFTALLEIIATLYIAALKFKSYILFRSLFILQIFFLIHATTIKQVFNSFTITYLIILFISPLPYKHLWKHVKVNLNMFLQVSKNAIKTTSHFLAASGFDLTIWAIVPLYLMKYISPELSGIFIALSIFQQLLVFSIGMVGNFFYSNIMKQVVNKKIKNTFKWIKNYLIYSATINILLGVFFISCKGIIINLFLGEKYNQIISMQLFSFYITAMIVDNIMNACVGISRIFKNALKYLWIRTITSYSLFLLCAFLYSKVSFNLKNFLTCIISCNIMGVLIFYIFIKRRISMHQVFYNL